MGLRIIEAVSKQQPVVFRTEGHAEWISLVAHGANRTPFYTIKSDGGNAMQVIQSILVPKGTSLAKLASKDNLTYLIDAQDQRVEHQDYDEFVQIAPEAFEPGTLQLAKLDDTAQVRVGLLKADQNRPDALVFKDVLQATTLDSPVPQPITVADVFHRERQALLDTIYGALGASGLESKKRRQLIFTAIDAFKTSMGMLVDQMGAGVIKVNKSEDELVEWFKDKEEFTQFVSELARATAQEVFDKAKEAEVAKAEAEAAQAEAAAKAQADAETAAKAEADERAQAANDTIKELETKLEEAKAELDAKVAELAEKQDQIGGVTQVDTGAEGPEGTVKHDKDKPADPKDWGLPLAAAFVARS